MLSVINDRFELLRVVGEGAYGVVYEANDRLAGKRVAVKILQSTDPLSMQRFAREGALLAELEHPSIVRYVGHGRTRAGQAYLAMQWLDGETLEQRLHGLRLTISEVVALAHRVAEGLAHASKHGIVHRDLKPGNIFLVSARIDAALLLDFGLARRFDDQSLTRSGIVVGTPLYMSPEQARGLNVVDARSDVFSLGSLLYECLCGAPPFEGPGSFATLAKICLQDATRVEALRPNVPPRLAELVHGMLAKDPAARPTYVAVLAELERIGHEHVEAFSAPVALRDDSTWSRTSLRANVQQRVLCVLFMGPVGSLSEAREQELSLLLEPYNARHERLLDGSRIVLFDQRLAAGEQAVAAATVALALRKLFAFAPLALCTGKARVQGNVPIGEIIDRGAVLLRRDARSAVVIDDATAGLIDTRYEIDGEEGSRTLMRERVGGEAPRTLLGQVTPFVGRERELTQLDISFDACTQERTAQVVLVSAPAGAGKSRLRYEFVEHLRKRVDFTLLIARGDSTRAGTPFGLLVPAIRAWAGLTASDSLELQRDKLRLRMEELLPGERGRSAAEFVGEMIGVHYTPASAHLEAARRDPQLMADRMLASWLEWLEAECARKELLFVVEDLHWSDPASVRYLDAALRVLGARPLFVLAFARPEVRDSFPALFRERNLMELRLQKLGQRACERLLDGIGAELDAKTRASLVERADGNPFFLEELVRAVRAGGASDRPLPDTILGMVQARLDTLGEEAKLVLRCASVFGQTFIIDAVEALIGGASLFDMSSCVRSLIDREVIFARGAPSQREYAFRHALLRDAAYALLPDEERSLAHRLAGEWLERSGCLDAALLADHFERGDVLPAAARWYRVAAIHALEASSLPDVVRFAERAAAAGLEGEGLAEVASMAAEAASYAGQNALAIGWSELAREHAPVGHAAWWRASQVLAISHWRQGGAPLARALMDEIIERGGASPKLPEQLVALSFVAAVCFEGGESALGALALARLDEEELVRLGGRVRGVACLTLAMQAMREHDPSRALALCERAFELYEGVGATRDATQTLLYMGQLRCDLGDYDAADRALIDATARANRIGAETAVYEALRQLGRTRFVRGQLSEAAQAFRDCVSAFDKLGDPLGKALSLASLALVLASSGAPGEGEQNARDSLTLLAPYDPGYCALPLAALAKIHAQRGELAAAQEVSARALELAQTRGVVEEPGLVRAVHLECVLASGVGDDVQAAVAAGRSWLLEAAAKIEGEGQRESFLARVPYHAQLLSAARERLGDERLATEG